MRMSALILRTLKPAGRTLGRRFNFPYLVESSHHNAIQRLLVRRERRRAVQQAMSRDEARAPGLRIVDTTPRSFSRSSSTMTSSKTCQMSFVDVQRDSHLLMFRYLLSMDKLWTKRKKPTPLDWDCLSTSAEVGFPIPLKL